MEPTAAPVPRHDITGVILAGGLARRMGGTDKGLLRLEGRAMVEHVLAALRPQVGPVLINANRNRDRYESFGYPVVADRLDGYLGPLAGMASGMQAATTPYVVTVPCDSPRIGSDLVARLYRALAREDADVSVAHDGRRMHPVFVLLKRRLLPDLLAFLESGGRKIDVWFTRHKLAIADFSDCADTFINVNNPEEHAALAAQLAGAKPC